ncbi:MAG: hypothetical protein M5Z89_11540 [Olivibacter sp.]|uniref:Uncharacterized protein n=1 Tax=Sphingobacterium sp. (strain 21) TaxID=743722 RepID=F4CF12_SPHS2|nr:hypothetical protein [Olivibacter sp. 47]MCL4639615.1 hypothetical protein [Olivibacter sp. UJ_SKK_5.1]MDM8176344.1 hypothetical protein [Olivibacter sp. 47]
MSSLLRDNIIIRKRFSLLLLWLSILFPFFLLYQNLLLNTGKEVQSVLVQETLLDDLEIGPGKYIHAEKEKKGLEKYKRIDAESVVSVNQSITTFFLIHGCWLKPSYYTFLHIYTLF